MIIYYNDFVELIEKRVCFTVKLKMKVMGSYLILLYNVLDLTWFTIYQIQLRMLHSDTHLCYDSKATSTGTEIKLRMVTGP